MTAIKYILSLVFFCCAFRFFTLVETRSAAIHYAENIEKVVIGSNIFEAMKIMEENVLFPHYEIEFADDNYGGPESPCLLQIKYHDIYSGGLRETHTMITFNGITGEVLYTRSWLPT